MARMLMAGPEGEALSAEVSPGADGARAIRFAGFAFPFPGRGLMWALPAAFALNVAALTFATFEGLPVTHLLMLVAGLAALLLAVAVAPAAFPAAAHAPAVPVSGLSPKVGGSGGSPTPLPFMGERIVLGRDAAPLSGLARAAERLRAMPNVSAHPWSELVARVSHDLRTPLNAVIGFSDVLEAELLGPVGHPRYREYARHIRDCGRELLKAAEDTLAITSLLDQAPSAATHAPVNLKATVTEAWAFHCELIEGQAIGLEAEIPEGLELLIDPKALRQIVVNLLAEAVRRSDSRGTVGFVATVEGDLAQIEVFLRGRPDGASIGQASLPICLARALLELNGAALIEIDDPHSTWRALTVLNAAAQPDFFARTTRTEDQAVVMC